MPAMMYGIQRSEKYKRQDIAGIEKEATRTAKHYNNDVDTSKSQYNINLVQTNNWVDRINDIVDETGVKTRKDSVMVIGGLYTATGEFFKQKAGENREQWNNRVVGYFKDCLDWHVKTYCQNNRDLLLSATIHQDETTPHMHIYSIPILKTDGKYSLSAKTIMGNRKAYTDRVDNFYNDVSKKYGLNRGERTPDGQVAKKHIETQKYKLLKMQQELKESKEELTNIEHNKMIADFDKMELDQQIKITESKKQKLCDEIHNLQIQTKKGKQQMQEIQQQIKDLQVQSRKYINDNKGLQKEIEQQSAVIAKNGKKIVKQQQDIQCYDNIKQTLAELQDWLSYDTYIHSVIEKMPNFYQGKMPDFLKETQKKYYNDNIKPIADYTNYLANEIQTNEQYIESEEMDL